MHRYFLLILLPFVFSCNEPVATETTTAEPRLDSTLTGKRLTACMPGEDINTADTAEGFTRMNTFFIENDSLYFRQFVMFDKPLWHDEEYTTELYIAVPMSLVRKGDSIDVGRDAGQAVCRWTALNNFDAESVFTSFKGSIQFWYRSSYDLETAIMFTENISFVNTNSRHYAYKMKYNTFGFADYGDCNLRNLPPAKSPTRHVWR